VTRILLFALVLISTDVCAIFVTSSLEDRVQAADLIVIGTLRDVAKQRFSITYWDYWMDPVERDAMGDKDHIFYYDAGRIDVERVLKGLWTQDHVPFACYSGAEIDRDGVRQTALVSTLESLRFTEGTEGIWLLTRGGPFITFFGVDYPGNCLPIDSLAVVEKLLESPTE
jgi:hypothetical protein